MVSIYSARMSPSTANYLVRHLQAHITTSVACHRKGSIPTPTYASLNGENEPPQSERMGLGPYRQDHRENTDSRKPPAYAHNLPKTIPDNPHCKFTSNECPSTAEASNGYQPNHEGGPCATTNTSNDHYTQRQHPPSAYSQHEGKILDSDQTPATGVEEWR